jgi:hypothetical protein
LADIHNCIGTQLHETGKAVEALAAFEEAKKIRERLARENPTASEFACDLSRSAMFAVPLAASLPRRGRKMSAQGRAERRSREAPPWVNRPPRFNGLKGQNRRGTWLESRVGDTDRKTLPMKY